MTPEAKAWLRHEDEFDRECTDSGTTRGELLCWSLQTLIRNLIGTDRRLIPLNEEEKFEVLEIYLDRAKRRGY